LAADGERAQAVVTRPGEIEQTLIESLERILFTGQGDASIDPGYGLPDVRGLLCHMPDTIQTMSRAIRDAITKYEPRLEQVRVRHLEIADSNVVHFVVEANLKGEETKIGPFETIIARTGMVELHRHG
jgi:type VI secretion system protein